MSEKDTQAGESAKARAIQLLADDRVVDIWKAEALVESGILQCEAAIARCGLDKPRDSADAEETEKLDRLLVDIHKVLGGTLDESTIEAARRVVAHRDGLDRILDMRRAGELAGVLGAENGESILSAAGRVMRSCEWAAASLEAIRSILQPTSNETLQDAAKRVMAERDKAQRDLAPMCVATFPDVSTELRTARSDATRMATAYERERTTCTRIRKLLVDAVELLMKNDKECTQHALTFLRGAITFLPV